MSGDGFRVAGAARGTVCHRVFRIWSSELRTSTLAKSICGHARSYCNKICVRRQGCGNARPVVGRNGFKCRDFSGFSFQWGLIQQSLRYDGMTTKHGTWCIHGDLSLKCLKLGRIW